MEKKFHTAFIDAVEALTLLNKQSFRVVVLLHIFELFIHDLASLQY